MNVLRWSAATCLLVMLAAVPLHAHKADGNVSRVAVQRQVARMLQAYGANDPAAVLALVDTRGFVIYGSDVAEVVRTPAQLRQLMADDFALWKTAAFGAPSNLDIRIEGAMASAFFDVPFSAGGGPAVTVRFGTVWRNDAGHWVLMQSANTVPTVGSSAHELANGK